MSNTKKDIERIKQRYLSALVKSHGHVMKAAAIAGITRMTVRNYRVSDPEFAAMEIEARDKAKEKFGYKLLNAFENKVLGEKVPVLDEEGNPVFDEDGEQVFDYKGGDTVAMIWASKNVKMGDMQWSDKQSLQVESGGRTMIFAPAFKIEEAQVIEPLQLDSPKDE